MTVIEGKSCEDVKRVRALDGLRGLAALSVVVNHYIATFFPHAAFGAHGIAEHEWQDIFSRSPLIAFYNGSFAVFIFFVLSGFVIAKSAASTTTPLVLLIGRRYLRLTIPMLCSTVLAYVLLKMFPGITQTAAKHLGNDWLGVRYPHPLTFFQATWDAVFNPYRFGEVYSNSVLWTMRIELFGSLTIYVLYALMRPSLVSIALAIIFFLLIPGAFFVGFMGFAGGAFLYQAWSNGHLQPSKSGPVLLVLGILLGGLPLQPLEGTNFGPIVNAVATFTSSPADFILGIAALILLCGFLMWPAAQNLLQWRPFRFLGRVSFAVYLVHVPLLMTLFLFIYMHIGVSAAAFAMLSIAYFLMTLLTAWALTVLVDEPVVSSLQRTQRLPSSTMFYAVHGIIIVFLLSFIISRLGIDFGSLLVACLGYVGVFVVLSIGAYNLTLQRSIQPRTPAATAPSTS